MIGFGAGLRGEEVPRVTLQGMLKFWDEGLEYKHPHMMITLYGRFKGENIGNRWYCIPISDESRSNIPFRKWVKRLMIRQVHKEGRRQGWLFMRKGKRGRVRDCDDIFMDAVEKVSIEFPHLFSKATVMELFSLRRSLRRGAVLETTGRVDDAIVKLINRWRTKESAKGAEPCLSMRQTYTSVKDALRMMLEYSRAL